MRSLYAIIEAVPWMRWSWPLPRLVLMLTLAVGGNPGVTRAETVFSGFGTLGGAISDQDFVYQRFVDDQGTLNRDTVFGLQLDVDLADTWRLTLQGKVAPAVASDSAWEPTLSWAFLSWRPSNDLLFRLGKFRLPLMLYSANSDVGVTFDFARLPVEVYSMVPTTDVVGLSVTKTWLQGEREWTLEGYGGRGHTEYRYYWRQGLESLFSPGSWFLGIELDMVGLVGTLKQDDHLLSIGVHHASVTSDLGRSRSSFPYVSIMPGVGYYQVSDAFPGPGVSYVDSVDFYVATVGAEVALPRQFRLIGEFARRKINNATLGMDTSGAYLALLKSVDRWTPYLIWSYIRSSDKPLDLAVAMNDNRIPSSIPNADLINASQVLGSDIMNVYDQQSFALGTSYRLSPTSKLKAEWLYTRTGRLSSFVDAPFDQDSGRRRINVFSLSYSFAF